MPTIYMCLFLNIYLILSANIYTFNISPRYIKYNRIYLFIHGQIKALNINLKFTTNTSEVDSLSTEM